jgi:hypothetical protein
MKRTWSNYDTPLWATILGWVLGIIIGLGIIFGLLCLESWVVMLLWNATLPALFSGVTAIGFWQSLCVILLIIILRGGVGKLITALIEKD